MAFASGANDLHHPGHRLKVVHDPPDMTLKNCRLLSQEKQTCNLLEIVLESNVICMYVCTALGHSYSLNKLKFADILMPK